MSRARNVVSNYKWYVLQSIHHVLGDYLFQCDIMCICPAQNACICVGVFLRCKTKLMNVICLEAILIVFVAYMLCAVQIYTSYPNGLMTRIIQPPVGVNTLRPEMITRRWHFQTQFLENLMQSVFIASYGVDANIRQGHLANSRKIIWFRLTSFQP